MNGNQEIFSVSSAEGLHRSPSAHRKIAKGYSSSKLPDCTSTRFTSSSRKGQNVRKGRSAAKGSIMETILLATNVERSGLVGGKVVTKRIAVPPFPSVADGGILEDFLSMPTNLVEDMTNPDEYALSAHSMDRHATDSPRQHSSSEKVSKWLEESERSSIITTENTNIHNLDRNEEQVVNGHLQGLETCCTPATEVVSHPYQDAKQLVEVFPSDIHTKQTPVKAPKDEDTSFKESCLAKVLSRFFQTSMCLSALVLGLFIQMRSTSWNQYEPPPT